MNIRMSFVYFKLTEMYTAGEIHIVKGNSQNSEQ